MPQQKREAADSILSDPNESDDDVFGGQGANKSPLPTFPEIPVAPPPSVLTPTPIYRQPTAAPVATPPPMTPAPSVSAPANPFVFETDQPPGPAPAPPQPRPDTSKSAPMTPVPATNSVHPAPKPIPLKSEPIEELPEEEPASKSGRKRRTPPSAIPSSGIPKGVFYAVVGFAVLMTLLAIYGLFIKSGEKLDPGHPLSTIPDSFGEFDPVSRKKVSQYKFPVDGELPANQMAGLGGKIEIGQLAIEPVKVEFRPLKVISEGQGEKPERLNETRPKALVMQLRITNTSNEFSIFPMDPAFTRKARNDDKPATRLLVGKQAFYGGAIEWPLPTNKIKRKYEEKQEKDEIPLKPGESRDYVVFSDSDRQIVKAVNDSTDSLLWRIQVRRGLIEFKGKSIPVTAIVGVEFKSSDVKSSD